MMLLDSWESAAEEMGDEARRLRKERDAYKAQLDQAVAVLNEISDWCVSNKAWNALPFEPPWASKMYAAIAASSI